MPVTDPLDSDPTEINPRCSWCLRPIDDPREVVRLPRNGLTFDRYMHDLCEIISGEIVK